MPCPTCYDLTEDGSDNDSDAQTPDVENQKAASNAIDLTLDDVENNPLTFETEIVDILFQTIDSSLGTEDEVICLGHNELSSNRFLESVRTPLGLNIRPGDTVEYMDCPSTEESSFLRVINIGRDNSGGAYLEGILIVRMRDLEKKFTKSLDTNGNQHQLYSLLPNYKNEMCAVLTVPYGTRNRNMRVDSALVRRSINGIIRKRVLAFNNHPKDIRKKVTRCPEGEDWREWEQWGPMYLAWKCVRKRVSNNRVRVTMLTQLDKDETDDGMGIENIEAYLQFLTSRDLAIEARKVRENRPAAFVDLTHEDNIISMGPSEGCAADLAIKKRPDDRSKYRTADQTQSTMDRHFRIKKRPHSPPAGRRLSYDVQSTIDQETGLSTRRHRANYASIARKVCTSADIFAGAGGSASGSQMAGLKVQYALEIDATRCKTLRWNFQREGCRVINLGVYDFIRQVEKGEIVVDHVDHLHISFPCQAFSVANTSDPSLEMNMEKKDLSYSLAHLLSIFCPRVVTLEQVPGVEWRDEGQHFRSYIGTLTQMEYNVQWEIEDCADHGVPHHRKRIFIMASCRGHDLPDWPRATYGNGRGLRPFRTKFDAMQTITRPVTGIMGHYSTGGVPVRSDPHTLLKGCVTGGGTADKYHYNGRGQWNLQQLAVLQTFSQSHHFEGNATQIKKQIGDAVPPLAMKAFCRQVIKALREMDKKVETCQRTR